MVVSLTSDKNENMGIKGWLRGPNQKGARAERESRGVIADKGRIAILPFANISPDPKDEYFADGMTEELISTLSRIASLKVISRTSVMRYKQTNKSVEEISKELTVGSILEGSVRKAANDLRITVKLIDVQRDEHIWSQDYERKMENVFAVQKEIARSVVESLKVELLPRDKRNIEKQGTASVEAYELYLKGKFLWNKRSKDSMTEAVDYFRAAIQEDHSFPLAHAGLADCFSLLVAYGHLRPSKGYPKAKQAIARALELDDGLAEVHASQGLFKHDAEWDWSGSEREYRRAIELNPNYATAHHWYSILLGDTMGRVEEGLVEAKHALELDPLSPAINANLADIYSVAGDYDLAEEYARKALELEPNLIGSFDVLTRLAVEKGMFQEAIELLEKAESALPSAHKRTRIWLASVHARSGNIGMAKQIFEETGGRPGQDYVTSIDLAEYYAAIGDKDSAFRLLNTAFERREPSLRPVSTIANNLWLRSISSDPRFAELLAKMNLLEYTSHSKSA